MSYKDKKLTSENRKVYNCTNINYIKLNHMCTSIISIINYDTYILLFTYPYRGEYSTTLVLLL